jgi:signal transduction histidine kinase
VTPVPSAGGGAAVVVGIEVDLDRLRAECVEPWLRRLGADRGVAFALLDARGRALASSGGKRAILGGDLERTAAFEALLPFWRLRAVPADDADEARAAWVRIAIQVGMIALLLAALVTGAVLALRAVHRSLDLARLKADFISNVSHELRTPLTSIRMFNDLLRTGRVRSPEKQQEYLETVGREAERLQRMIDDILDFARHEAGRKTYELEDVDLGDLAGRVLGQMRPQLEGEGFKVAVDIERPLPPVRADPGEVAVAVRNLLSNARKYSPDRKEVAVRVFRDDAGRRVACEVKDRGAGIDPKDLPRVFEKFYRGGDALTRGTPGSGLGLAMVKRIVEDMGGEVGAESERGEGSAFTIRLPVAGAQATGGTAAPLGP